MEVLQIGNTDIILQDYGEGRGKIIVSDTEGFNFSHYWGSMGSSLNEFLLRINEGYFSMKLTPPEEKGEFNAKLSVRAIRKYIKDEMSWDLPWYKYMALQKEFRQELKNIEQYAYDQNDFISKCIDLTDFVYSEGTYEEEREFKVIINSILYEPWHFIVEGQSKNTIFLERLLPKIKKQLSN